MLTNTMMVWVLGPMTFIATYALYRIVKRLSFIKKLDRYLDYPSVVVVLKNGECLKYNSLARKLYNQNKSKAKVKNVPSFFNWLDQQETWINEEKEYLINLGNTHLKRKIVDTNSNEIKVCYYSTYTKTASLELEPTKIPPLPAIASKRQVNKQVNKQVEIVTSFSLKNMYTNLCKDSFCDIEDGVLIMGVIQDVIVTDRYRSLDSFLRDYFKLLNNSVNPWLKIFEINARYQVNSSSITFETNFSYRANGDEDELFIESIYREMLKLINNDTRKAIPCFEVNYRESSNIVNIHATLDVTLATVLADKYQQSPKLSLK